MYYGNQTWGQIHWKVIKYKYKYFSKDQIQIQIQLEVPLRKGEVDAL